MSTGARLAAMRLELQHIVVDKAYVALTVVAAMSFIGLVSLFGLTASDAPMALVVHDRGPYVRPFVEALAGVPHAFRLTRMTEEEADRALSRGRLVGAIIIPSGFSDAIASGETVPIEVEVDNVNVDIVTDVQRALPAAIAGFGAATGLPGLRARIDEHDVWPRDTSFLRYITVSGLALAALIVAATLGALAVAREIESGTLRLWQISPASLGDLLLGKILASSIVGLGAMAAATLLVVAGYGIAPARPWAAAAGLLASVVAFTSFGAWVGTLVRRTLVIVPLLFGLAMPLYIDSGALEPTRFDGERISQIAHFTPLYYVVAWFEWAFFGLVITPEPPSLHFGFMVALAAASFLLARRRLAALALTTRGAP